MQSFEQPSSSSEYIWYDRAKATVQSFLPRLDPALRVEVDTVTVTRDSRKYQTYCLRFSSDSDPALTWTMEIEPTDRYIEQDLEPVVRKIYQEHVAARATP